MIKIGEYNELEIVREADFGYYLDGGTGKSSDDILLPKGNALGKELKKGDVINAFIYRDSKDRKIATLKEPKITVGEVGYLKIVGISKVGAFANFGLERDVLVPLKEQKYNLQKDKEYLLYMYVDKTGRLAATTDIDRYLEIMEDVNVGDEVSGIVYGYQTNNSLMIAIDGKYKGVILKNEYFTNIKPGDTVHCRVKKLYEDGMVGLTPRKKKLEERNELQEKILKFLKENDGIMSYNDKSTPEEIKKVFNSSKNYFKMALGGLMKEGLIKQDELGTRLK